MQNNSTDSSLSRLARPPLEPDPLRISGHSETGQTPLCPLDTSRYWCAPAEVYVVESLQRELVSLEAEFQQVRL